jgi:hypothetical protein
MAEQQTPRRLIAYPFPTPRFTRDNVADVPAENWRTYRKVPTTGAVRVVGAFEVETREGILTCPDGYLAIDAHGWPYPIAKDEFEAIYEAVPHHG